MREGPELGEATITTEGRSVRSGWHVEAALARRQDWGGRERGARLEPRRAHRAFAWPGEAHRKRGSTPRLGELSVQAGRRGLHAELRHDNRELRRAEVSAGTCHSAEEERKKSLRIDAEACPARFAESAIA